MVKIEFKCCKCGKRLDPLKDDIIAFYDYKNNKRGIICLECSKKIKNAVFQDIMIGL